MANRERGESRLVTAGAVYILRLDVATCCELEDRTEQQWDAIAAAVNRGRVTELRWILWAALQPYYAALFPDPEAVTTIIDEIGSRPIRSILSEFLARNANDDTEPEGGTETPPDTRPGSVWRKLYLDLREQGVPAESFWRLSLCELWREVAALKQRQKRERDHAVAQAWWIAALVWQKKLPALDKLLSRDVITRPPTPQEKTAALKAWARAHNEGLKKPKARKGQTDG